MSGNTGIEVGIDSFAAAYDEASLAVSPSQRLRDLVEQIEHAGVAPALPQEFAKETV